MRNFRKYDVWNDSMSFVKTIYEMTTSFPKMEQYGLSNQMNRAAVSIASNIAEGASRNSDIDFAHFLEIAIGSSFEIETQIEIAFSLGYIEKSVKDKLISNLQIIQKRLNVFISKLRQKPITNCQ
jgi:four helix bundle protein